MKSTNKDMADSLFFWGVAKVYQYGIAVAATDWIKVSEKKRQAIENKTDILAATIVKNNGKVKPGIKTKGFFYLMRALQKKGWNEADIIYWKEKGWSNKERPWKQ